MTTVADLDNTLVERIEELARAQIEAERIIASIVVEFQVPRSQVCAYFQLPEIVKWLDDCALAGQADIQARMWQVARDLTDTREGVQMAQWLARNFLGHSGTDVSTEVKQLLAQLKADPTGATDILDQAMELLGGKPKGKKF